MLQLKVAQRGKAQLMLSDITPPNPPALQAPAPFKQQQPMQMPLWAPQHVPHMPINSRTGQQLPAAWQMQTPPNMQSFSTPKPSGVVGQDAIISTRF
jgi:hypothetical protein